MTLFNSDHQPPLLHFVAIRKDTHVSISIIKMCITSVDQYEELIKYDMFYYTLILSVLLYRHFFLFTLFIL